MINLKDISYEVNTKAGTNKRILDGVSASIAAGELVAIEGTNGSGKTTLLNIIGLMRRPTAGECILNGNDTGPMKDKERAAYRGRKIGIIFQNNDLIPYRTVEENIMVPLLLGNLKTSECKSRAAEVMNLTTLSESSHVLRHADSRALLEAFMPFATDGNLEGLFEFAHDAADINYTETDSVTSQIESGELLFLNEEVGSFASYELLSMYFGGEICFPEIEGVVNTEITADCYIFVSGIFDDQEAAADYLDYILSDEFLLANEADIYGGIPATETAFDRAAQMQLQAFRDGDIDGASAAIEGEDGTYTITIEPHLLSDAEQGELNGRLEDVMNDVEEAHANGTGIEDEAEDCIYGPRGTGDYEKLYEDYIEYVESSGGYRLPDPELEAIVNEEFARFVSGESGVGAGEAAAVAEQRIAVYLSENESD